MDVSILVCDQTFIPPRRDEYIKDVISCLPRLDAKIVFLDPDTGLGPPEGTPQAEHATVRDIQEIWASLKGGDILAVYQHAFRRGGWLDEKRRQLENICGAPANWIQAPNVAADIAVLWSHRL